eukprot:38378-Eustigmatos_ZCMA.PRE.1
MYGRRQAGHILDCGLHAQLQHRGAGPSASLGPRQSRPMRRVHPGDKVLKAHRRSTSLKAGAMMGAGGSMDLASRAARQAPSAWTTAQPSTLPPLLTTHACS